MPLTEEFDDSVDSLVAAGISQQWTRSTVEGIDQIVGIYRCEFEQGQQRYALNLPVYPAFGEIPTVEAICLNGDGRIRITDRQKFGVRLEIVLPEISRAVQQIYVDVIISGRKRTDRPT